MLCCIKTYECIYIYMLIQYSKETKSIYDQFWNAFWATFTLSLPFCLAVSSTLATKCIQQTKKEECQKALQNWSLQYKSV